MITIKKGIGFLGFLTILTTPSCGNKALEKDMDRWCACSREAKKDRTKNDNCMEIMLEIVEKYEFDPAAAKTIEERALECR